MTNQNHVKLMNYIYLIRVMKIIVFFLIAGFMTVSASSYSQRITMKGNNIPFERVVEMIREQTGYSVFTSKRLLRDAKNIHIDVVDLPLEEFLERITADQAIDFQLEDKTI